MPRRILFVAEAVSIAHVARPTVLAAALDAGRHEIHFASSGEFAFCHAGQPWTFHRLHSQPPARFLQRLAAGKPVWRGDELAQQAEEDLRLLRALQPDLVVHDFRLSLGTAARVAGVPLWSICNAHWSPYRPPAPPPAPDVPAARWLGHTLFDPIFRAAWPLASRLHTAAANRLRRRHGLAPYPSLAAFYTDGDEVLYADVPELLPLRGAPPSHRHLGPIVWSPQMARPAWWEQAVDSDKPLVYVTVGSTGNTALLPSVLAACRAEGLACLLATAGRSDLQLEPPWGYAAPFLPGSESAAAAAFVVCNGGSATAHQALAQGRPVLGLCSNLDQLLTMQSIEAAGAGICLRASAVTPERLRDAVRALHREPRFGAAAARVQAWFAAHPAAATFARLVEDLG